MPNLERFSHIFLSSVNSAAGTVRTIDTLGQAFGRLTVLHVDNAHRGKATYVVCHCICGREKSIGIRNLLCGGTRSCGCLRREATATKNRRHGYACRLRRTAIYGIWVDMRKRCLNPHASNYAYYGGRGIAVCARWENFQNFLADMGPRPPGMTIERVRNNDDYEPSNCIWADRKTQARNTRTNRLVQLGDRIQTLVGWCEELGLNYHRTKDRLGKLGWPPERALAP